VTHTSAQQTSTLGDAYFRKYTWKMANAIVFRT